MKIAVIHGYLLNGTGSNLYVQNLCRQLCISGHDVMLFCQDVELENYDFIESAYRFDKDNENMERFHEKRTPFEGKCRCFVPNIGKQLPVYVKDMYDRFEAVEITKISRHDMESYINANKKALRACFMDEKPDVAISNHIVMQPVYTNRALEGLEGTVKLTVAHGSSFNFSVRKSNMALNYALEGLNAADGLVFLTDYSQREFEDYFDEIAEIKARKMLIPAGVDIEGFFPLEIGESKSERIKRLMESIESEKGLLKNNMESGASREFESLIKNATGEELSEKKAMLMAKGDGKAIDPDIMEKLLKIDWENENILLYYGKYLWTKGIHNIIISLPFILKENPNTRLVLVGFGTSRGYLETLVNALDMGDLDKLKYLLKYPEQFQSHVERGTGHYSKWVLDILRDSEKAKDYMKTARGNVKDRVVFTGFMDHGLLRDIIPCADVVIAPSIFPEAFGLVGVEALACGVLPLQTYHSGFKCVVDSYEGLFELDGNLKGIQKLCLDENLVRNISCGINAVLQAYRSRGEELVLRIRKDARNICVDSYSWRSVADRFLDEAQSEMENLEKVKLEV
ncbi:Glycosyl transferases group 1 [Peptoclostridium litorale DSM 5388]|uniref:Glycosyl transferase, group 1 n=1 Tax=Peptoclostridium litorale DSM 5388 TaxID=1121324 RepID=A0A069RN86_PEPLI|nr:glycosyltransferase family 4 protein [Peptoclostridium litorale]KDR95617.1 glycosyl transferase, group 1 [Peptoclostridium litorale DSM 5388]SIN99518.1 Glycosyl transferases group 1 [Peptoclostridium litorale DSM 5388]